VTRSRDELLALLRHSLPSLLPAHTVLIEDGASVNCDVLYVQGRIDRLHAFAVASTSEEFEESALLARLEGVAANWRWLVVPAALAAVAGSVAASRGLGVVTLSAAQARLERPASPVPGIFDRAHPDLRKAWRARSDF
jgi:hypothetical protein